MTNIKAFNSDNSMEDRVTFKCNIGLFMATMIGIGAMVGPGIFLFYQILFAIRNVTTEIDAANTVPQIKSTIVTSKGQSLIVARFVKS
jgi:hypothetical protein